MQCDTLWMSSTSLVVTCKNIWQVTFHALRSEPTTTPHACEHAQHVQGGFVSFCPHSELPDYAEHGATLQSPAEPTAAHLFQACTVAINAYKIQPEHSNSMLTLTASPAAQRRLCEVANMMQLPLGSTNICTAALSVLKPTL